MSRRDEENKAFSDLCYEAWRDGHNPDNISRDRFDDKCVAGYYPDEISYKSCLPHRDSPQEEQQYPNEEVRDAKTAMMDAVVLTGHASATTTRRPDGEPQRT